MNTDEYAVDAEDLEGAQAWLADYGYRTRIYKRGIVFWAPGAHQGTTVAMDGDMLVAQSNGNVTVKGE